MNDLGLALLVAKAAPVAHVDPTLAFSKDLDRIASKLTPESAASTMKELFGLLNQRRALASDEQWATLVATARRHQLAAMLHEDPLTRRAVEKPRGYAGDAVLIDLIYAGASAQSDNASPLGRALLSTTAGSCVSAEDVRERKEWCAGWIDDAAEARPARDGRILSVACGHMRELGSSHAYRAHRLESIVCVDQDPASLDQVRCSSDPNIVRPEPVSVRSILRGDWTPTDFDLIYSAGLYDYLPDEVARRLTMRLFAGLRLGGRLIFANFVPGFETHMYMQTFMDWSLICRTAEELGELGGDLPEIVRASRRTFLSTNKTIAYVEFTRR